MNKTLKKIVAATVLTALSLQFSTAIPNKFQNADYSITVSAASEAGVITYVNSKEKLGYMFVPHSDGKTCTLYRIYDNISGNTWRINSKNSLTIPSTLKDNATGKTYTVTELGYENQSIFHNYNDSKVLVSTLTLPSTVKKINRLAIFESEAVGLKTLNINLDALEYCSSEAFGATPIINLNVYNSSNGKYKSVSNVSSFESAFSSVINADYVSVNSTDDGIFKPVSSAIDGKLTFLNAIIDLPYTKRMGYEYAKKIVADYNINAASSAQQKYEMIYNYLTTHNRYSGLYTTFGERMLALQNSSLSNLALHSGVCGSYAYAFEQLCTASDVSALCIWLPQHVANVVSLDGQSYYVIDCTGNVFMRGSGEGAYSSVIDSAFSYGIDTTPNEVSTTTRKVNISSAKYCDSFSYAIIKDMTNSNFEISLYDKNNTGKKYVNYTTRSDIPKNGTKTKLNSLVPTKDVAQYIDSHTYYNLSIKKGNTTFKLNNVFHGNKNSAFTIDGVKYNCCVETLDYSSDVSPHSSYKNYFKIVITKA